MGLGAILCPDRIGQPASPSFHPQNRLTGLMVIARFNLHAEHNWSETGAPPADAHVGGSVKTPDAPGLSASARRRRTHGTRGSGEAPKPTRASPAHCATI